MKIQQLIKSAALAAAMAVGWAAAPAAAQSEADIGPRAEGDGPFDRLVIRNAFLIDGSGAPAQGPMDIVIVEDRIAEIRSLGAPGLPAPEDRRASPGTREIDAAGGYVLPGFVNLHGHIHSLGTGQDVPPDYVFKLWLGHGVTTVREVSNPKPAAWLVDVKRRSARNEITAPRVYPFVAFGSGSDGVNTAEAARAWVRGVKRAGADGIKFFGAPEEILWAALEESDRQGLRTTMHHAQLNVTHANVLTTSEHGLDSMEHWYGLPEALFTDRRIQNYPPDYIYHDEQHRFSEAGRLWKQAAAPYSDRWNAVMDTLLDRNFAIVPTFTIYLASRDWMRARRAEWHDSYTMPSLWDFFRPDRDAHGSYWFDWGTEQEVAWRENYKLWMTFINEYKNRGGLIGVGEDAGYIYSTYGFGYIQELELLREAGFHPLEVFHSATLMGAKILGVESEIGSVQIGKKADLVIVSENPLANLKVLYGTGHIKLDADNRPVRVGGVDYTIKDGIVYDARELRQDVLDMVAAQKAERGIGPGPMPIAVEE